MCNMNKVVRACVCVCVRVCVRACVRVCVRACMCVLSEYWFCKTPSPYNPNKSWHKQWKKQRKKKVQHD